MKYCNMIHKISKRYQVASPMIERNFDGFLALGIVHFISGFYIKMD